MSGQDGNRIWNTQRADRRLKTNLGYTSITRNNTVTKSLIGRFYKA